jgi:hypothetical protein
VQTVNLLLEVADHLVSLGQLGQSFQKLCCLLLATRFLMHKFLV